jgi:branched-subunit amino acid ABC-type transport system permease component
LLVWPELELPAIYAVVVAVLLLRPAGLFGKPAA